MDLCRFVFAEKVVDWFGRVSASPGRDASMHSSMISKIDKAHRYAQEPERIKIDGLAASFSGSHDEYRITLQDGHWNCTCHTFESHAVGTCAHVMALQQMLGNMMAPGLRFDVDLQESDAGEIAAIH
jgi:hypothetical protein